MAVLLFCFKGKKLNVDGATVLSVDADELDVEFLRLAKHIPARKTKIWRKICAMLSADDCDREKVVDFLKIQAIVNGLGSS
jgi:hypothetical protein